MLKNETSYLKSTKLHIYTYHMIIHINVQGSVHYPHPTLAFPTPTLCASF